MPEPLAFFLTWPTYGTWLPGDGRGWVEYQHGWQLPDSVIRLEAAAIMKEGACILDRAQRSLVEKTIADHCRIRGWQLHAVNCRTNHLHIVVAAHQSPHRTQVEFKAWCSRRLKELASLQRGPLRENWWAERGSRRYINDESSLAAAIAYVREGQNKH
jgi:REP element-mobilizing transposase RayT